MWSVWARRLFILMLAVTTVGTIVMFGASSVKTSIKQRQQIIETEHQAELLDEEIAKLTAQVRIRTSPEGGLREALCFGPYVEPGTEVYAIVGLNGCVVSHP